MCNNELFCFDGVNLLYNFSHGVAIQQAPTLGNIMNTQQAIESLKSNNVVIGDMIATHSSKWVVGTKHAFYTGKDYLAGITKAVFFDTKEQAELFLQSNPVMDGNGVAAKVQHAGFCLLKQASENTKTIKQLSKLV